MEDTTLTPPASHTYNPSPWWHYLLLTGFFTSYGLGRDVGSNWGYVFQGFFWLLLACAAWAQWRNRRASTATVAPSRKYGAATWAVILSAAAANLAVLFGGPLLLTKLGVPFPHAICGLATGLLILAVTPPLGRWSARRAIPQ